jgi:hypothetical protein
MYKGERLSHKIGLMTALQVNATTATLLSKGRFNDFRKRYIPLLPLFKIYIFHLS